MDSHVVSSPKDFASVTGEQLRIPGWAVSRGRETGEADAAFAAGAALKSLDDMVRAEPAWAGCWRARQALKCAAAAVRLMGRNEEEAALRDAVLLPQPDGDAGPAGKVFLAFGRLGEKTGAITSKSLAEIAELLSLKWDDKLSAIVDLVEDARQSGRAIPFAAADLVTAIYAVRPDAEVLAWGLADWLIAKNLGWTASMPLLMTERYGSSFRTQGGKGRVSPGEDVFPRAFCLALVSGIGEALRTAGEISRRAERLLDVTPKVRTKGGGAIIRKLLEEDAVAASASGTNLSRWATTRMFERLETFGAVRELSGRSSFRIYGL